MATNIRDVNFVHLATVGLIGIPFFFIGRVIGDSYHIVFYAIPLPWEVVFSIHFFLLGILSIPLIGLENRAIWFRLFTVKISDPPYSWPSPIVVGALVGFLSELGRAS